MVNNRRVRRRRNGGGTGVRNLARTVARLKNGHATARARVPKDPPSHSMGLKRSGVVKFLIYKANPKEGTVADSIDFGNLHEIGKIRIGNDGSTPNRTAYNFEFISLVSAAGLQLLGSALSGSGAAISVRSITFWGGDFTPRVELIVYKAFNSTYPPFSASDAAAKNHKPVLKWSSPTSCWQGVADGGNLAMFDITSMAGALDGSSYLDSTNSATIHIAVDLVNIS